MREVRWAERILFSTILEDGFDARYLVFRHIISHRSNCSAVPRHTHAPRGHVYVLSDGYFRSRKNLLLPSGDQRFILRVLSWILGIPSPTPMVTTVEVQRYHKQREAANPPVPGAFGGFHEPPSNRCARTDLYDILREVPTACILAKLNFIGRSIELKSIRILLLLPLVRLEGQGPFIASKQKPSRIMMSCKTRQLRGFGDIVHSPVRQAAPRPSNVIDHLRKID